MWKALVATMACAPLLAQTAAPMEPTATVTLHVLDEHGLTLEECRVDRFVGRDGTDLASHFHGLQGTKIPWGMYSYTLKRPLGGGREGVDGGRVGVTAREMLFVVQAGTELIGGYSADRGVSPGFVIKGRLEPAPTPKSPIDPVWVRLSPVHGSFEWDVSVDRSGEFRILYPLEGLYVLSVIEGDKVLHVQPIEFGGRFPAEGFVVKVPSKPPEVISPDRKNDR